MSEIDVTIFIRSRNEAALIGECLRAISEQKHSFRIEVLVLDSESTDGTPEIAVQYGARVLSIPRKLFTYSSALNAGVHFAKGKFFVCLSAHCVPASSDWLEQLLLPLDDPNCAATYSRQIPWPDVSIPEALQISRAFPDKQLDISPDYWRLSCAEGKEPFQSAFHSNTSAAYKTEVIKKYQFKKVPFAEDRLLAGELLTAGYSLHYANTSIAYHSHYPCFQEFRAVARSATFSRYLINLHFNSKGTFLTKRSSIISQLKIPFYVTLLSIGVFIPLLPGRKSRLREFYWRVASLGTTIGKSEGIQAFFKRAAKETPLEIDSSQKILEFLAKTAQ